MPKPNISIELYSVRDELAKDVPGTLAKLAAMGYRYVEPAGCGDLTPQAFGKAIQRSTEVLRELRQVFGIKMRPVLDSRIGYAKQQATARALIDEELEKTDAAIETQEVEVGSSAGPRASRSAAGAKPAGTVRRKRARTPSS